jgi:hypothetical protein
MGPVNHWVARGGEDGGGRGALGFSWASGVFFASKAFMRIVASLARGEFGNALTKF